MLLCVCDRWSSHADHNVNASFLLVQCCAAATGSLSFEAVVSQATAWLLKL